MKASLFSLVVLWISLGMKGTTLYNCLIIVTFVYFIHNGMIQYELTKVEFQLLLRFEQYLSELRHYFYSTGMIEEAIFNSLEQTNGNIALHINKIYEILITDDILEVENYKEIAPNKFFLTFLALCQISIQYGDTIHRDQSLFLTNLNSLKNEINIEILKRKKINHVFSGLISVTIMPVFTLKIIENWSTSNLEELQKYYNGAYGIIVSLVIFLATLFSYQLIRRLKSNEKGIRQNHYILEKLLSIPRINKVLTDWIRRHYKRAHKINELIKRIGEGITIKQFYLKRIILGVVTFSIMNGIIVQSIHMTRFQDLNYVKDFETSAFASDKNDIKTYQLIIKKYSNQYSHRKVNSKNNIEAIKKSIGNSLSTNEKISNDYIIELLINEIMRRVTHYQQSTYQWYYLALLLIISYLFSHIPYLSLLIRKHIMRMSMEDEVMQFQAIIIMLMYVKKMNVQTMLHWMENIAEIFRPAILECIDTYNYDEELAFLKLKEKEPFLPFHRIVQNLEACDRVGIEKAFDEVKADQNYFAEKRKQENEIMITNKGVIGKIFAYIPMFLTLMLYLIVPFVLESFTRLMSYVTQIQGF